MEKLADKLDKLRPNPVRWSAISPDLPLCDSSVSLFYVSATALNKLAMLQVTVHKKLRVLCRLTLVWHSSSQPTKFQSPSPMIHAIYHPQFYSSVRCKQHGRQQMWWVVEKSAKFLDIKGDLVADSVIKNVAKGEERYSWRAEKSGKTSVCVWSIRRRTFLWWQRGFWFQSKQRRRECEYYMLLVRLVFWCHKKSNCQDKNIQ